MTSSAKTHQPVYLRLRDHLIGQMKDGALESHSRLPSERELSQSFSISRMTVRQALVHLENEGLIYRSNRRGWFVAPPRLRYDVSRSVSFADNVVTEGGTPRTIVLSRKTVPPPAWVRERLGTRGRTRVYRVRRLRLIGRQPAMLEEGYILPARCPDLIKHDLSRSYRELWQREYGIAFSHSSVSLSVIELAEPIAKKLGVRAGSAGMLMTQVVSDQDGRPFFAERQYWRSDLCEFGFEVDAR